MAAFCNRYRIFGVSHYLKAIISKNMDIKLRKSYDQKVNYKAELDKFDGKILSKSKADKCEKMIQKFGADGFAEKISEVEKQSV